MIRFLVIAGIIIAIYLLWKQLQSTPPPGYEDDKPLAEDQKVGGSCADLEEQGVPEGKEVFFIPSLYVWLQKHRPNQELTPETFDELRALCPAILMDAEDVRAMEVKRNNVPNDFAVDDWNKWYRENQQ